MRIGRRRRPGSPLVITATAGALIGLLGGCGGAPNASVTPPTSTDASSSPIESPSPSPSSSPTPAPSPPPTIRLDRLATVDLPLGMAVRAGDPALYIVSKSGTVHALRNGKLDPTPVLDVSSKVSDGSEQGLLGLAFSPDGRFAYVNYTDRNGDTNVVEYAWRDGRVDPATARRVLFVDQPFPNHNGGNLVLGPDGDLHIGMGDGGSTPNSGDPQGDPHRNGQNVDVLLGKMLRIEPRMSDGSLPPDGQPYAIPSDNPFVGRTGARPEIWAYGLRNPWRFSFDRSTGDLWIGDVGAGLEEEVDVQRAGSKGGENYGWNAVEGTVVYRGPPADAVGPVYEYNHSFGGCAITGGYVYRGNAIPDLDGWYVFGDFCLGFLSALRADDPGAGEFTLLDQNSVPSLSSFGQDQDGELYALSLAGGVYKLVP